MYSEFDMIVNELLDVCELNSDQLNQVFVHAKTQEELSKVDLKKLSKGALTDHILGLIQCVQSSNKLITKSAETIEKLQILVIKNYDSQFNKIETVIEQFKEFEQMGAGLEDLTIRQTENLVKLNEIKTTLETAPASENINWSKIRSTVRSSIKAELKASAKAGGKQTNIMIYGLENVKRAKKDALTELGLDNKKTVAAKVDMEVERYTPVSHDSEWDTSLPKVQC